MAHSIVVAPIVEGHADREAVPILLRRIAADVCPQIQTIVCETIRHPKGTLTQKEGLERAVHLAATKAGSEGLIVIVLDADEDCPATLGPQLLAWAQQARSDIETTCVVAKREFEAWFVASVDSLAEHRGIAANALPPDEPEELGNPKAWLERCMSGAYVETLDQPAFAARFDYISAARRSSSLEKLVRDFGDAIRRRCFED